MEKKYKYKVGLYADGSIEGFVELTKQEAELVSRITNPDNWEITEDGEYYGSFEIEIDNPIEIE